MNKIYIFTIIILAGIVWFMSFKVSNSKSNIVILSDSISVLHNKNGDLTYFKESAEISLKDLENINKKLYDEVKYLKDNPIVVEHIETKYEIRYVYMESKLDSIVMDSIKTYNIYWEYDNKENLFIKGITSVDLDYKSNLLKHKTYLDNLSLNIELYGALIKEKKGKLSYRVTSKSPYVSITKMDGFIISNYKPKPKKFGISVFGGPSYDFVNKSMGASIGIGLSYDVLQLF